MKICVRESSTLKRNLQMLDIRSTRPQYDTYQKNCNSNQAWPYRGSIMGGNYRGNVCQSVGFSQLLIGESPRQGYEITVATITSLNCRLNPTARLKASSWGISKVNDSSLSRGSRVPSTGNIRQSSSIQDRRTLPISRKC